MPQSTKRKLRIATVVYWGVLLYVIAALAWWAFSLLQQNNEIYRLQNTGAAENSGTAEAIEKERMRNVYKYVGEGCAFLLLILIGAFYVYRSVRRQFRLQQQQQNFVMAVTHELKTPLAVARLNLETLQKHQLEEEKRKKLLQTALQETLRLDTLINNILLASQLEDHAYRTTKEDLDFSALVKEAVKRFENRYPDRPVNVFVDDAVEISGDAALLKLLLSNLLENANKYSPKGRPVTVRLTAKDKEAQLAVSDEGGGIPDDEKEAVFEKFYRIGNEQTRKAQGTGLGLYICRRIAADHNAGISVKDNAPAGSKFIVQFYRT